MRGGERPQGRVHRRLFQIVDRVAEVVGARLVAEVEVGQRARELVLQRPKDDAVVAAHARLIGGRGGRRLVTRRARHSRKRNDDRHHRNQAADHGSAPLLPIGLAGDGGAGCNDGAGSVGGLSLPLSRRSVSNLLHQQAGARRRDRHEARLGAAVAVERLVVVGGRDDLGERRQRRPDQIDAAHELVRPPVDPDAIDENRQHLERLRPAARGVGEAPRDVAERQAVELPLALGLVAQHLPQLRGGDDQARLHDQVPLARDDRPPLLPAPVAVRNREAARRRAAQKKAAQDAGIDQRRTLRLDAFVVVAIKPVQIDPAEVIEGRVVEDRDESGMIGWPIFLANVCPSSSLFCRCPSTRWPKISWKKTPAAFPSRIAGPA